MVSSILPNNERQNSTLLLWYVKSNCFCSFFGTIEDTEKTFRIQLTFSSQTRNTRVNNFRVCFIHVKGYFSNILSILYPYLIPYPSEKMVFEDLSLQTFSSQDNALQSVTPQRYVFSIFCPCISKRISWIISEGQ